MTLTGTVVDGGGFHADTQRRHGDAFASVCGYRPYPGSLNVALDAPLDPATLGPPAVTVTLHHRFRLWPATLPDLHGPAHLMVWTTGTPLVEVEVLAPVRLRDLLPAAVYVEVR